MRKHIILIAAVFLITGCESKKEQAKFSGVVNGERNYAQEGIEHLKKAEIKEAVTSFEMAIKRDPRDPENYITLGQVYLHLKNPQLATELFTIAANIDHQNGEALYLLGFSKALTGDRQGGIEDIKKSAQIFMQKKDEEKLKRSVVLLKNLTESQQEIDPSDHATTKTPEQVLGLPMDSLEEKTAAPKGK